MKTTKFRKIENIVKSYPELRIAIKNRKDEILYPYVEQDENSGIKGQLSGNSVENVLVKLSDDDRLATMIQKQEAIQYALSKSDELTQRVIELYYFDKRRLTWEEISRRLYGEFNDCSVRTLKRKRNDFFEVIEFCLNLK